MKNRQSGLTMLEVLIASIILAVVVSMAGYILWSSSNHVTSSQIGVQLESQAREIIAGISKELRQAKMNSVRGFDTTTAFDISTPSPSFHLNAVNTWPDPSPGTAVTYPYVAWNIRLYNPNAARPQPPVIMYNLPSAEDGNPTTSKPHGIRFNIPGNLMDLDPTTINTKTGIRNVNADRNGQVGSDGKVIDNFDLGVFKNNATGSANWTTEIQYWRDPDLDNPWTGGGKISSGVIKKFETFRNSSGVLQNRKHTVIARNVADLTFVVLAYPAWVTTPAQAVPQGSLPPPNPNQYSAGAEKYMIVSITLTAPDPKHPKDTTKLIYRTVTSAIELRN